MNRRIIFVDAVRHVFMLLLSVWLRESLCCSVAQYMLQKVSNTWFTQNIWFVGRLVFYDGLTLLKYTFTQHGCAVLSLDTVHRYRVFPSTFFYVYPPIFTYDNHTIHNARWILVPYMSWYTRIPIIQTEQSVISVQLLLCLYLVSEPIILF